MNLADIWQKSVPDRAHLASWEYIWCAEDKAKRLVQLEWREQGRREVEEEMRGNHRPDSMRLDPCKNIGFYSE